MSLPESPSLDQLRWFLFEHVEDLEELEILACLRARSQGATLTVIANEIRFPLPTVLPVLERLVARGIVSCTALEPAEYRFEAPDAETRQQFERVFEVYRADPSAVMKLMTSNAIDRVRTAAMRTFADGFRLKGPKSHG
jgi:hypothetical protein